MYALTRRSRRGIDIWPGFVDALATLLIVIIFLLMMFSVAQFFLQQLLSGRNEALEQLNQQVAELSELLSLERKANAELRLNVAQLSAELQSSIAQRDELSSQLGSVMSERDALRAKLAQVTEEAGAAKEEVTQVRSELEDAFKVIEADKEKIALQLRELESLRRDIAALREVRETLEAEVTQLSSALEESKAERASLKEELTAVRDRTKELETRLATEEERTALAQKQLEKRDIRLRELLSRAESAEAALEEEEQLSERQRSQIALLNQQIAILRQQLARLAVALEAAEAKAKEQNVQIADLGRRLNIALAGKVEELARYRSEFFGRLREVLGERRDIRIVGDRFVFQSEIFFDTASAELGDPGKQQLHRVAGAIGQISDKIPSGIDWILQVEGHTDARPIHTPQYPSNWELSTARALSVVRFLIDQGIPPGRLAAAGYGEHQPIDSRETEEAYRRNRRIELKLTQASPARPGGT